MYPDDICGLRTAKWSHASAAVMATALHRAQNSAARMEKQPAENVMALDETFAGSEPLLEGKCIVWKNNARVQQFGGSLVFDNDLQKYKVLGGGTVAYTFGSLQVKGIDYQESGTVKK